jgi:UDP-N-acetylmuramyl pentapeptide phosphotransferase/UDP-N-acetylglucosamine-1-phosphate transferase
VALVAATGLIPGPDLLTPAVAVVLAAAIGLALVGAVDDLRPIAVWPRLLLQCAAVAAVVAVLPSDLHIVAPLPQWLERTLIGTALLWFVNLVNFMDGLDWMTVAEMLPISVTLAGFGLGGALPIQALPLTLALAGALAGFAPFNRPVARLFLGDVGSLPLGLLIGWCLVLLAGQGHLLAAILLPLYYLADATWTLLLRLRRGEKVWEAHRSHFYQRATNNGYRVMDVVREVFLLNVGLAAMAACSLIVTSTSAKTLLLIAGAGAVTAVLARFSRPKN